MKYLVIAEKPELGRAIANAIPSPSDGSIVPEGTYTVLAARGHLLELKMPEEYDPAYKAWNLSALPIAFPNWEQRPKAGDPDILSRLDKIETALKSCDCVIHAGDPDDEGQFLIDEILQYYHNTKPVKRLLINELSKDYIRKQMQHLEDNKKYEPLGVGAYARSVADLMFGINYTRFFTKSYQARTPLSVGRVQTPTLGLVVNRDRQIEGHVQQNYFTLHFDGKIDNKQFPCNFVPAKDADFLDDGKVLDETILQNMIPTLEAPYPAATVKKSITKEEAPLPFNLVKLQTFCGAKMKLTPEQTLQTTQTLREKYNLITYNRSDCQYLNDEQFKEAPGVINTILSNLNMQKPAQLDTKIKSKCFNSAYTTAHHAIIPTTTKCDLSKLSNVEYGVYQAICLYYMLQFMPPKTREKTVMTIPVFEGKHKIEATSFTTVDAGWYGYAAPNKANANTDETPLSQISAGTYSCNIFNGHIEAHKTTPPKRYTEYSLNEDMTRIARYVKDPAIKQLLLDKDKGKKGENGSIGTSATRATIIKTLFQRGYVKEVKDKKGSHIESTELGRSFYDMLPEDIKGADVTAKWWVIMEGIKDGSEPRDALYNSVLNNISETIKKPLPKTALKGLVDASGSGGEVVGKCPRCGRDVVVGKKGYGCVGWRDKENPCKFTIWMRHPLLAQSNRTVTKDMAKKLLSTGAVRVESLKSKKGRRYGVTLVMEDTGEYVNLNAKFQ